MTRRALVHLLLGLATLIGCEDPYTTEELAIEPRVSESLLRYEKVYVLGPGDEVDVIVRGNADVSRRAIIRPDGYISMPLLGDVRASGHSIEGLAAELTRRFSARLLEPEVTVIATKVREPMVYVVGEVRQPQPIPYRVAPTAAQAIARTGGFSLTAHERAVAIIRMTDEGRLRAQTIPVEIQGKPAPYLVLQATLLRPDDIVYVPPTDITQVNRFIDDHINKPLSGANSVLSPIANYLLIEDLIDDDD